MHVIDKSFFMEESVHVYTGIQVYMQINLSKSAAMDSIKFVHIQHSLECRKWGRVLKHVNGTINA